uniref:Uncharacterized protein n=1 Tax=Tanacetum cinerariifolium TaxID=118510 RepID=A0A699H843_TANCI|nr:hypothetical protein [Tanacetum cinerariifolium]
MEYSPKAVYDISTSSYVISAPKTKRVHIHDICTTPILFADMALPQRDHRHPYLRFEGLEYTDVNIYTSKESDAWRWLLDIKGPLVREYGLEFFSTYREFVLGMDLHMIDEIGTDGFRRYWTESSRMITFKGDLREYWEEISSTRDFLTTFPSYVAIRDPVRRLCHRLIAYNIAGRGQAPEKVTMTDLYFLRSMDQEAVNLSFFLAFDLFRLVEGRKSGAHMSEGHFTARLADHFRLLTEAGLQGLTIEARDLTEMS